MTGPLLNPPQGAFVPNGAAYGVVGTFTAAQTFQNTKLLLQNPAATFSFIFNAAAITANRNVTIPLLTADDTFVMANFAQTIKSKLLDSSNTHVDATDTTKAIAYSQAGMTTGITLTLSTSQSTSQTLTVPNITASDTLAVLTLAQTFVGAKTFSATAVFTNSSPFSVANGQTLTASVTAQTVGAATLTIPNFAGVSDTFAFITLSQVFKNKKLDATNQFVDTADNTKVIATSQSGMTTGVTLTEAYVQTTSQTLTFPNITGADTVAVLTLAQTLTNKTFTSPTINGATISGTFTGAATFASAITFSTALVINAKIGTYNSIATAGGGIPAVYASYSTTANTGAVTNAINYTPPATAGRYRISGIVNMTAWTTPASFTVAVTYKDDSGNARTETMTVSRGSTGATAAAITAVDRWYFELPLFAIDNSATAITVSTTGTFTGSPSYNLSVILEQVA